MKKIISIISILLLLSTSTFAVSQKDLDAANQKIKDAQKQVNANKQEQSNTLGQINTIDGKISSLETQVSSIMAEIERLKKEAISAEENIDFLQDQYDQKMDMRKKRAVAYYKSNITSLDTLTYDVEDPSERMYLQKAIEKITDYENNLLEETKAEKENLVKEQEKMIEDSIRCAELQDELEMKIEELGDQKIELNTKYAALKDKQAELEKTQHDSEKEAKEIEEELKRIASSSSTSKYTGGKMTWPIPGAYYFTAYFGKYPSGGKHTGVDIARAGGATKGMAVVAAADGTVIKVVENYAEKVKKNGYGAYVIIDHGGGIQTLYGHSSKVEVKVGQKVKAGQEIMKAGTSGNSTGPHLHFEVRKDGVCVNPLNGWISLK